MKEIRREPSIATIKADRRDGYRPHVSHVQGQVWVMGAHPSRTAGMEHVNAIWPEMVRWLTNAAWDKATKE